MADGERMYYYLNNGSYKQLRELGSLAIEPLVRVLEGNFDTFYRRERRKDEEPNEHVRGIMSFVYLFAAEHMWWDEHPTHWEFIESLLWSLGVFDRNRFYPNYGSVDDWRKPASNIKVKSRLPSLIPAGKSDKSDLARIADKVSESLISSSDLISNVIITFLERRGKELEDYEFIAILNLLSILKIPNNLKSRISPLLTLLLSLEMSREARKARNAVVDKLSQELEKEYVPLGNYFERD
ncbi:MAG: hypothetical protein ACFFD4_09755 [Candidatus Odinarchaeota archaeon]